MRILATLFFLTGFALFAQDAAPANVTNDGSHPDPQVSKTIEATEKSLNEIIKEQNDILKKHTRLLKVKVEVLPTKTFIYKGVPSENQEDCEYIDKATGKIRPQEADDNTCLKLVIFDFEKSEEGKSELSLGSRSKYISVFFAAGVTEKDPKKVQPGDVTRIISKIRSEQFKEEDLKISYVTDEGPAKAGDNGHNDVVKVFYQHDGLPFRVEGKMPEEQINRKGYGVYSLSSMDNTITNPYRNEFKQTYYVKHLDKFNKLFTAIYDMNEAHGVKRYKESNQILKNSLAY